MQLPHSGELAASGHSSQETKHEDEYLHTPLREHLRLKRDKNKKTTRRGEWGLGR